ncbi:NADH-quinone oxidoreductase subunit C [Actinomadura harenae]|uniref:NADH-quinone oxidoreductase subunit C n=1 Tax=Actinomadura harenae TaxID=2483351 RepID=A0A3M2MJV1_9ACTN|nr:NADH-quinone oxidoreductase subunit C [Actinomadura harenae]RMI47658.1 NADH-quinone oxidoreductase subunit C [Actinomadura harenae]
MSENKPEQDAGGLPARREDVQAEPPVARMGMFGIQGSGDTSGYGGLVVRQAPKVSSPRPFGGPEGAADPGEFDEVADTLEGLLPTFGDAVERIVVHRGELTLHVRREHLVEVATTLRDAPDLRFEMCMGVSGVHYPEDEGAELHAVYPMLSITHNRRIRLDVSCPDGDPHIPSLVRLYPTNDWHERETFDFFGIVFDGHPALTRIMMPDDWVGHPQRKDYPLGGIPVEYRGAEIPPPDQRRSYQ